MPVAGTARNSHCAPTGVRVLFAGLVSAVNIHRYLSAERRKNTICHAISMNTFITLVSAVSLASALLAGSAGDNAAHSSSETSPRDAVTLSSVTSLPHATSLPNVTAHSPQKNTHYQSPTGSEPEILKKFSPGTNNWNPGHRGVDVAMEAGDTVYASASGKVIYAGILVDREVVSIEDSRGIRTTYEPVIPEVTSGDTVRAGDRIGTITGTHCGNGVVCLHWGAKRGNDSYINPMWLLRPPIVRLLE